MVFKGIWSEFLLLMCMLVLGRSHEWSLTPLLGGAGGFLVVDGKFVSWFATKFDDVDGKGDRDPFW